MANLMFHSSSQNPLCSFTSITPRMMNINDSLIELKIGRFSNYKYNVNLTTILWPNDFDDIMHRDLRLGWQVAHHEVVLNQFFFIRIALLTIVLKFSKYTFDLRQVNHTKAHAYRDVYKFKLRSRHIQDRNL